MPSNATQNSRVFPSGDIAAIVLSVLFLLLFLLLIRFYINYRNDQYNLVPSTFRDVRIAINNSISIDSIELQSTITENLMSANHCHLYSGVVQWVADAESHAAYQSSISESMPSQQNSRSISHIPSGSDLGNINENESPSAPHDVIRTMLSDEHSHHEIYHAQKQRILDSYMDPVIDLVDQHEGEQQRPHSHELSERDSSESSHVRSDNTEVQFFNEISHNLEMPMNSTVDELPLQTIETLSSYRSRAGNDHELARYMEEVDIMIPAYPGNQKILEFDYSMMYHLHKNKPYLITRTLSLADASKVVYGRSVCTSHNHETCLVLTNTKTEDMQRNKIIIYEKSISTIPQYLGNTEDISCGEQCIKRTRIAKCLLQIVAALLEQRIVLLDLHLNCLMYYGGKTFKLIDVSSARFIGELLSFKSISVLTTKPQFTKKRMSLSFGNLRLFKAQITPEMANKFFGFRISRSYKVRSAHAVWGLGIVLLELFTGVSFLSQIGDDEKTVLYALSVLQQSKVDEIIEDCFRLTNFADASHLWLRKELVKILLKVKPEERPHSSEVLKLKMFLECDNADVLYYLIDRNAPFQVFADLLLEDHSASLSSYGAGTAYHDHDHDHEHQHEHQQQHPYTNRNMMNYNSRISYGHSHNMVLTSTFSPVSYALKKQVNAEIIEILLQRFPSTLYDKVDDMSLIEYAVTNSMDISYIRVLLPHYMPIDFETGKPSNIDHSYGWSLVLSHMKPPDKYLKVVEEMLELYSAHSNALAHAEDEVGRSALHIATAGNRALIISYIYFLGRYKWGTERPEFRSSSCMVRFATDTQGKKKVALKFMKNYNQFQREIQSRNNNNLSAEFVLEIIDSFDSQSHAIYARDIIRRGYGDFNYCIVLPRADRTLQSVMAHEHVAGRDWATIRSITTQLLRAVAHIHSKGIIHGDLKRK